MEMEIVWQTPANPPERHDYIFRNGNFNLKKKKFWNKSFEFGKWEIFLAGIDQGGAMWDRTTSSSSLMYVYISVSWVLIW